MSKIIAIAESEVEISAIRAQGAGGQNVNKVSSAIHLRFDVLASSLPDDVKERLLALTPRERAAQPCIGSDRADLVLAGAAILRAVQEAWPCARARVADRGLREGLLLSLMSGPPKKRRRRRCRRGGRSA